MTRINWYPAAAASVVVLGCGGSADNGTGPGTGTGGSTSIDGGTPMSTGGRMAVYYGILTGGNAAGGDSATATGGKTAQTGLGGYITIYGPRFDKLANNLVSTGGSNACIAGNAEGGALQGLENRTCNHRGSQ
jgi:hypothetical protein